MNYTKTLKKITQASWLLLKSPKAIGALKLAAAVISVIHAMDELNELASKKRRVGFIANEDD